ncbi:MAG TPA: hypothetical protein VJT75_06365 [Thermoleophilaceae bacterium]|nr:hypothetical protein [Thermoleophilaceae bacterium]
MTVDEALKLVNRGMIAFDLALGTGTLLAPRHTLWVLGHERATPDTENMFRRQGPVWLTFALAHAVADRRGRRRDWWALAWLRGTEIATDAVWAATSPGFTRPGARVGMVMAGVANTAMAVGFGRLAEKRRKA